MFYCLLCDDILLYKQHFGEKCLQIRLHYHINIHIIRNTKVYSVFAAVALESMPSKVFCSFSLRISEKKAKWMYCGLLTHLFAFR